MLLLPIKKNISFFHHHAEEQGAAWSDQNKESG